jgi:hypothetical protein
MKRAADNIQHVRCAQQATDNRTRVLLHVKTCADPGLLSANIGCRCDDRYESRQSTKPVSSRRSREADGSARRAGQRRPVQCLRGTARYSQYNTTRTAYRHSTLGRTAATAASAAAAERSALVSTARAARAAEYLREGVHESTSILHSGCELSIGSCGTIRGQCLSPIGRTALHLHRGTVDPIYLSFLPFRSDRSRNRIRSHRSIGAIPRQQPCAVHSRCAARARHKP